MESRYDPMTYSEVVWWTNKAKTLPRRNAEDVQRFLLSRAAEVGVASPEVLEAISGITVRFVEEDREMRRELMAEELRRLGTLQQEKIDADDDQIVQAMKWTLAKFKSDWDWGGVYRILVDCCDFPPEKTAFVRRFARMGVYPKDNTVKNLDHALPPAIRGTEWHDHPFSYQAIQKGVSPEWPQTYYGWLNSDIEDRNFTDRREIAKTFKENLIKAVKTAKGY